MRITLLCLLLAVSTYGQTQSDLGILGLEEYLGWVKQYHPVAKQADLRISEAQAQLLRARGAFDPKIEIDWDNKDFDEKEYYNILNSSFKIPTWFGIELAAGFERNSGVLLNPQNNVPENGLYKAGISVPLGQGLFINKRMAGLRQAKILQNLNEAERQMEVNKVLYEASLAYFEWYVANKEVQLFENTLEQAEIRFNGIRQSALAGDLPAIDTLEAGIIKKNRALSLERANLKLIEKRLELSNFLWIDDNVPVELNPDISPEDLNNTDVDAILQTNLIVLEDYDLNSHPKLRALNYKLDQLNIERRLKAEMLKPQLDIEYNFINENISNIDNYDIGEYTFGVYFKLPIFLRKERGELNLTKAKVQQTEFELDLVNTQITNKISQIENQILSYQRQVTASQDIANDNQALLEGEERKFSFGESSVFLLNQREVKYIEAQLKYIETLNKLLNSRAKLFNILALEL
ncbi:TolC family protein [Mesohalobacter halotolerans]|uniref:TolC family protein n=1 Tax=Mesohalobacter halotolerans TaxID=1883405 RepID=A0A4U5TRG1_9FLAO|nr:TolC family protein [Mesohalobacter halotolerans]TKS55974.1 TolC family protein [Mesohalobacter halotolerans]